MIIKGNLILTNTNITSLGKLEYVVKVLLIRESGITKEYMEKEKLRLLDFCEFWY